jgi:hypothetical protein
MARKRSGDALSLRELGRATLARQMLLQRARVAPAAAIESLVSLQAQHHRHPYVGLWTRLTGFDQAKLASQLAGRKVVRATMMRHTLHLVTTRDYLRLRPAVQPALDRSLRSIAGKRLDGLDLDGLVDAARAEIADGPRSFAQVRALLAGLEPDREPSILGYLARTRLRVVQIPPGGDWGFGGVPLYADAEDWLSKPLAASDEPDELVLRYLAAFGPATVADAQTWSGLAGLRATFERLRPKLRSFSDPGGREVFDLPDAPRPADDTPAPVRFLPEFDNLVVAHADRTRLMSEEHRRRVSLKGARVLSTFLVDGRVHGTWKVERAKGAATLVIEPFARLPRTERAELIEEGERLVRFVADDAESREVRVARGG